MRDRNMQSVIALLRNRPMVVELFVIFNLAFLALDVLLAHSINEFGLTVQWLPVLFSAVVPLLLGYALVRGKGDPGRPPGRMIGMAAGLASIAVGVGGMVLHLESRFFLEQTIRSLVYTAPFVAPLAYAGLGFLLLLNRMIDSQSTEWGQWVIFLALGGFAGNFALSLADHAQNGFFDTREWIPVFSSALAIGFLCVATVRPRNRLFLRLCVPVLILQAGVGVAGFLFHFGANIEGPSGNMGDNFLYGAPIFAPLLFADLAVLAMLGTFDLIGKSPPGQAIGRAGR